MANRADDQDQAGGALKERIQEKTKEPALYGVVLLNDDYTTMEFVIWVLEYVFMKEQAEAITIMLKVHNEGVGIAGIYPYDIAYMKSQKAMNLAQAREYPLLASVEEE